MTRGFLAGTTDRVLQTLLSTPRDGETSHPQCLCTASSCSKHCRFTLVSRPTVAFTHLDGAILTVRPHGRRDAVCHVMQCLGNHCCLLWCSYTQGAAVCVNNLTDNSSFALHDALRCVLLTRPVWAGRDAWMALFWYLGDDLTINKALQIDPLPQRQRRPLGIATQTMKHCFLGYDGSKQPLRLRFMQNTVEIWVMETQNVKFYAAFCVCVKSAETL